MGELYRQKQAQLRAERLRRKMPPEQIEMEHSVDMILQYMSSSTYGVPAKVQNRRIHQVDPMKFNGAEPLCQEDLFHQDSNSLYFLDVRPPDLSAPLDVTVLKESHRDADRADEGDYQLLRFRQIAPKAVRGWARRFAPTMVQGLVGWVDVDKNTIDTARAVWSMTAPFRWVYSGPKPIETDSRVIDRHSKMIQVALGMAFSREYQWRVHLGWDGLPGISFPTDPVGAREVFRLRDIPEGGNRRSALRNWITEHWRKTRSDSAEETKVRAHLRGATEFHWNGLRCIITPSRYDQEQNARMREEAERRRQTN